jgi:hypothetical protein
VIPVALPPEYALANDVDHARTLYFREADVVPELDAGLARVFDPAAARFAAGR